MGSRAGKVVPEAGIEPATNPDESGLLYGLFSR